MRCSTPGQGAKLVSALENRNEPSRGMFGSDCKGLSRKPVEVENRDAVQAVRLQRRRDGERQIGVARYSTLPDQGSCEFAIVVGDDWQNKGLARRLMRALIEAARARRYTRMVGMVLKENHRMIEFSKSIGFKTEPNPDDPDLVDVEKKGPDTISDTNCIRPLFGHFSLTQNQKKAPPEGGADFLFGGAVIPRHLDSYLLRSVITEPLPYHLHY